MIHHSLPQTFTPEQLADYIRTNRIATQNHVEKFPLTEEEKRDLAVKSSLASRQILKLETLLKMVSTLIKKGTPWNTDLGKDGDNIPVDIVIPPTGGIDKLKSNREYADGQIEKGYREEVTPIYFLPWPEYEKIVACDIEGKEWTKYSRKMTNSEIQQHGKPILSASTEVKEFLEKSGVEIERVDGKQVTLKQKKSKKDTMPELSDAEKEELEKSDNEDPNRPY